MNFAADIPKVNSTEKADSVKADPAEVNFTEEVGTRSTKDVRVRFYKGFE